MTTTNLHPQTRRMISIAKTMCDLPQRSENLQGTVTEIRKMAERFKIGPDALPFYPVNSFTLKEEERAATTRNGVALKEMLVKASEVFEGEGEKTEAKIRVLERKGNLNATMAVVSAVAAAALGFTVDWASYASKVVDVSPFVKHAVGTGMGVAALAGAVVISAYRSIMSFKDADAIRGESTEVKRFFSKVKELIEDSRDQFVAAAIAYNSRGELPGDVPVVRETPVQSN